MCAVHRGLSLHSYCLQWSCKGEDHATLASGHNTADAYAYWLVDPSMGKGEGPRKWVFAVEVNTLCSTCSKVHTGSTSGSAMPRSLGGQGHAYAGGAAAQRPSIQASDVPVAAPQAGPQSAVHICNAMDNKPPDLRERC